jgi:small subunit ribosomal protein S6
LRPLYRHALRVAPSAPGPLTASSGGNPKERRYPLMRKYELVCVIHPDLDETAFNGAIEKIKGWIVESGGTTDKVDVWGRRRLAYPIRKQMEGQYVLFNVSIPPQATAELERNLRFLEPVMRFLFTLVN